MIGQRRRVLIVGVLMMAGAALALAMKPGKTLIAQGVSVNLETVVPLRFGEWQLDKSIVPIALPTELQATQDAVYDQTLVRTYVNQQGERIMLTVAYGGNQSRQLQVHRPEVCYAALGFQILSQQKVNLPASPGETAIPAMQLVAAQGSRNEPVTYWIRLGDRVVRGNLELGLARLSFGLRGFIPDGILFRASSITNDNLMGFQLQQKFISDLLTAVTGKKRELLVGNPA